MHYNFDSYLIELTICDTAHFPAYSVQSVSLNELVWKTTSTRLQNIKQEPIRQAERRISGNEWKVGKYRLNLVNSGECPSRCMVTLNITDDKNKTVWAHQAERTYAMRPVIIRFNSSVSGFLLKFWQWNSQDHVSDYFYFIPVKPLYCVCVQICLVQKCGGEN